MALTGRPRRFTRHPRRLTRRPRRFTRRPRHRVRGSQGKEMRNHQVHLIAQQMLVQGTHSRNALIFILVGEILSTSEINA